MEIADKTGNIPEFTTTKEGYVRCFKHPESGQVYIQENEIEKRIVALNKIRDIYKSDDFSFKNQVLVIIPLKQVISFSHYFFVIFELGRFYS